MGNHVYSKDGILLISNEEVVGCWQKHLNTHLNMCTELVNTLRPYSCSLSGAEPEVHRGLASISQEVDDSGRRGTVLVEMSFEHCMEVWNSTEGVRDCDSRAATL